jgi:branched-chain amino acid transport system substrate-binding protein
MNINLKSFIVVCSILLILISGVGWANADTKWLPAPETIDIGASMELSGPTALTGYIENAMVTLGVEKVNKDGGIYGIPLRLIGEDSQGTNPGALAAINKLVYEHEVLVPFIGVRSTMNHAISPLILEAKIPAAFGGTAWSVIELRNPWMFGFRTNDRDVANIMAKFIVEDLGQTKLASLHSDEAFGQGGHEETTRALKKYYGIEPLTTQSFARGTKDYTPQLLAIKQSGASCIYSWSANAEDNAIILRQIRQLGLNVVLVGGASYGNLETTVKLAGKDAEGIYSIVDFSPADESPIAQEVNKELMEKYNLTSGNPWMYDGVLTLADAIRRSGIIKEIDGKKMSMPLEEARAAIREALAQTKDFHEGTMRAQTCDENNVLSHEMTIVQIKDGWHKVVKKIDLMQ